MIGASRNHWVGALRQTSATVEAGAIGEDTSEPPAQPQAADRTGNAIPKMASERAKTRDIRKILPNPRGAMAP
jgi:hypothetical protein